MRPSIPPSYKIGRRREIGRPGVLTRPSPVWFSFERRYWWVRVGAPWAGWIGVVFDRLSRIIDDEILLELYDYWLSKRRGRAMPSMADIDAMEITELLPNLLLVDVEGAGTEFRLRMVGATLTPAHGFDRLADARDVHLDSRLVTRSAEGGRSVQDRLERLFRLDRQNEALRATLICFALRAPSGGSISGSKMSLGEDAARGMRCAISAN